MLIPKNSKDVAGIRGFLDTLRNQACSLASTYEGPVKQLLDELTTKLQTTLAALPKDTDGTWKAEDVFDCLFNCLASANAITSQLGLELSKMKNGQASLITTEIENRIKAGDLIPKDKLAEQVASAIKLKTDAGELVVKETVTQLCSQAKLTGIEEEKTRAKTEAEGRAATDKLIGERKTALTQASLVLPDAEVEAVLGAPEAEFNAAKALFETRKTELKEKHGITLAAPELLKNLWLPEASYKVFKNTITGIPALRTEAAEPLAGPGAGAAGAPPPGMFA